MVKYSTSPKATKNMPKGIPYIIGNELAERFSFYGMKCILIVFMTKYLMDHNGNYNTMSNAEATHWYHLFTSAVYYTPILGAIISDVFLGKYKTILFLSIIYCLGHLTLALDETAWGLAIGLSLISVGAGGIKPCVSAHVGDQFGKTNSHLLEKVFSWFYLSINLGAFISTMLTPILLKHYGSHIAFGIPGILMFIATILFWMGRNTFIHIPPGGMKFLKEIFSREGLTAIGKLCIIYIFIAPFWSLFDQTGSTWIIQAENLNRNWLGINWLPSQIQAINPIMILIFAPTFTYFVYPKLNQYFELTPLKKINIGLFLTVPSFLIIAYLQSQIDLGNTPSIAWQILAYAILTAAEVLVSITCLEFSYTQAPNNIKSLIMGLFMLSIAVGNTFTMFVNSSITNVNDGASFFFFFAKIMLLTALLFMIVVKFFRSKTYLHQEH
ncbi:MAG: MFS transporter [Candidatus Marinimicrobia bacterium]|nr:MFS transporter [Candidatus Neomarinimicrobiota bacterium]